MGRHSKHTKKSKRQLQENSLTVQTDTSECPQMHLNSFQSVCRIWAKVGTPVFPFGVLYFGLLLTPWTHTQIWTFLHLIAWSNNMKDGYNIYRVFENFKVQRIAMLACNRTASFRSSSILETNKIFRVSRVKVPIMRLLLILTKGALTHKSSYLKNLVGL